MKLAQTQHYDARYIQHLFGNPFLEVHFGNGVSHFEDLP